MNEKMNEWRDRKRDKERKKRKKWRFPLDVYFGSGWGAWCNTFLSFFHSFSLLSVVWRVEQWKFEGRERLKERKKETKKAWMNARTAQRVL